MAFSPLVESETSQTLVRDKVHPTLLCYQLDSLRLGKLSLVLNHEALGLEAPAEAPISYALLSVAHVYTSPRAEEAPKPATPCCMIDFYFRCMSTYPHFFFTTIVRRAIVATHQTQPIHASCMGRN
jgi:hypothetical protein